MLRSARIFLIGIATLLLAACDSQSQLYSQLSESSANDVIAELASHGVASGQEITEDGVTIYIDPDDTPRAVALLNAAGLPQRPRTNLGEMFEKDGIISTPFAEKARYIFSLSQELESTLRQIDGIVTARVQVVLPDRVAPGEPVQPASASVFLKHSPELDPDVLRSRIRQLVAGSIPGLGGQAEAENGDKLSVVFVPAKVYEPSTPKLASFGPFEMAAESASLWSKVLIAGCLGVVVLVVAGVWLRSRRRLATKALEAKPGDGQNRSTISELLGGNAQASNDGAGEAEASGGGANG